MNLSEKIQSRLFIGDWAFDNVAHTFQSELAKKVNSQKLNKNISELCIANYRNIDLSLIDLKSTDKGLHNANLNIGISKVIQDVFSKDYPKSSIIKFEDEVSRKLRFALKYINRTDLNAYYNADKNITSFLRLSGVDFRTASHPHLYGVILIGDGIEALDLEQTATSIIHELAHQELFLINLVDRLVNQPFDHNEIHAPFQGKKRPPIGRLHSLWALYRMVEFQIALGNKNSKYYNLLVKNIAAFEDGELTAMGKALVQVAQDRAA